MVRRSQGRRIHGREAVAGGGSAGSKGRCDRQHSGGAGIGDKGARDIIAKFGSVEAALDRAAEVERKMYRESLQNNRPQIELSKKLATIATKIPVEWDLEALKTQPLNNSALKVLYKELEFFSLLKDLPPEDDSATRDYTTLSDEAQLAEWLARRKPEQPLAVALDLTNSFAGLSYRTGEGRAIPLSNMAPLRELLESESIPKLVHDAKAFLVTAAELGITPKNLSDDAMLYAFLLSADPGGCSPENLAERFLDRKLNAAAEQQAEATLAVAELLRPQLETQQVTSVYREIDLPLAPVLAQMEMTGIRVDTAVLAELSVRLSQQVEDIAQRVYQLAGHPFNINSPQQLGKVLFEEMDLPSPVKYGKGKTISTAADILEGLANAYPVAQHVLDYRQLTKLKGTYIDALPLLIRPNTGACIQLSTRLGPPQAGYLRRIQICKISLSVPRKAAKFAPRLYRKTDGICWWRIIRKLSYGCWRTCREIRCWWMPSPATKIFIREPPLKSLT